MKLKHVRVFRDMCLAQAGASECTRRKFGAVIVDPVRNVVVATGYNGGLRGGARLCGGEHVCLRTKQGIKSGTRTEVGCVHAEANALANAAAGAGGTQGCWLFVGGEPCVACAKLIAQAGIVKVLCVDGGYLGGKEGCALLRDHGVEVQPIPGPSDPRTDREPDGDRCYQHHRPPTRCQAEGDDGNETCVRNCSSSAGRRWCVLATKEERT